MQPQSMRLFLTTSVSGKEVNHIFIGHVSICAAGKHLERHGYQTRGVKSLK